MNAPYNRVLSAEDYESMGVTSRKAWEVTMALNTLRDLGAVHDEAVILGAGAGHEATIYHLSNEVKQVVATDLYDSPGMWKGTAQRGMLTDPAAFAPDGVDYDLRRIVVQHMDMTDLRYPDNTFDGVFSSGSIEHVGSFDDVAKAASELGRVLKPGGILSLSTEWKLSGEGDGWPGVLLFDYWQLLKYIIEPSGCEMVDALRLDVPEAMLEGGYPLEEIVRTGRRPAVETVIDHKGYLFTSVHVALRK